MQEDLFGVVNLDLVKEQKKKRRTSLNIHLKLNKVCIGSVKKYQCRSIPYSPNYLNRKHWAVKAAWKKAWEEEIWALWLTEKSKWKEYKFPLNFKVNLNILVFCISPQDQDNAIASMKGVIDGLIKCGIIKNDTYNDIVTEVQFIKVKHRVNEHLELHITKHNR